jgi:GxxExxY protein
LNENETAAVIVDASYKVHTTLGPGLLESVYQAVLSYELTQRGMTVSPQQALPVIYESVQLDTGYRADLIVNGKVIVELKSVESIAPVHKKQLLTYLRLSGLKLGLLINFGSLLIKNGITRVVNGL